MKLPHLDFTLPQVDQLSCSVVTCPSGPDSPFPSLSTFPSLEALFYTFMRDTYDQNLDTALIRRVTTFSTYGEPVGPDSSFLRLYQLQNLRHPTDFIGIAGKHQHLQIPTMIRRRDLLTSNELADVATNLGSAHPSSIRLSRLYLPTSFESGSPEGAHREPGITASLSACSDHAITVVFEDFDTAFGGHRTSHDFLDFAKAEKAKKEKELMAEEKKKAGSRA
jgi:hypothetical protein